MLRGISPKLSPELLLTLYRMEHGDEIVLADAHFPGESYCTRIVRADGHIITDLLDGILPLMPLDSYVDFPMTMMEAVNGDTFDPRVEQSYKRILDKYEENRYKIRKIEKEEFYKRSANSFAVVMSGETAKYGNIILQKGIIENAESG
ncbi:MAG: L-fucose mutarotase [Candidatus Marinimicrobia bacterium]|nr:L-fucose mutarotase [Candidatus Neomarinimicrobiota bacterium]MCF7828300.1 L-fucose mutarotase [Candidatus Neomarinimicrobiota bacterium]MCF7879525.1 L-fucose mutarotase [Candidatus Neomarinimicrobiota bacterium]